MRLLRPHQKPWLHPASYAESETDRFANVHAALTIKSAEFSFLECLVVFGGDHGFHIECRLLRNRIGDWLYELDCHEQPYQSLLIDDSEVSNILEQVRTLHQSVHAGHTGVTKGPRDPIYLVRFRAYGIMRDVIG